MSWLTVPNTFPDPDDLSAQTWYDLQEGYGIYDFETRPSGKYYKKVRANEFLKYPKTDTHKLISVLGFKDWHLEMKPRRSILRFILGDWKSI